MTLSKRIADGSVPGPSAGDGPAPALDPVAAAGRRDAAPSHAARYARRVQVVAYRDAGLTYDRIALLTGLSRTGVFDICKRQARWGEAGLHDAPGGQRPADGRRIDAAQEAFVRRSIIESTPDRCDRSLWTHAAASRMVQAHCGLHLPVRTLAAYLARWGFVAPRSLLRATAAPGSPDDHWLGGRYLAIAARARLEDALIVWGDHRDLKGPASGVRGRRDAAAPAAAVCLPGLHTMTSAVDNRGRMRWVVSTGPHGVAALIDFLSRLVTGARQKVFLLMRPHAVHRCPEVLAWLIEHEDAIELFDLPLSGPVQCAGGTPAPAVF